MLGVDHGDDLSVFLPDADSTKVENTPVKSSPQLSGWQTIRAKLVFTG